MKGDWVIKKIREPYGQALDIFKTKVLGLQVKYIETMIKEVIIMHTEL